VRNTLALTVSVCLFSLSAVTWTAAQMGTPSSAPEGVEDVLVALRADLQGNRADILAKNLTLTSDQAAKFWPAFNTYQKEQNVIMDEQLKGLQRYIETFDKLDDAGALALINAHLDRDEKMVALRKKWLSEFQKLVGTKTAVRVIQIDRRLSFAHQVEFSSRIPLVH